MFEKVEELPSRVFVQYVCRLCFGSDWKVWAPIWHVLVLLMNFDFMSYCAQPVVLVETGEAGSSQFFECLRSKC
jgi:hypothetical protein